MEKPHTFRWFSSYTIVMTFILITKGAPDKDEQEFLNFVLSDEGQTIVEDMHYITLE